MDMKTTNITVYVSLDREELRLIGLGLAGRLKDRTDIEAASALNLRLLEARRHRVLEELARIDEALGKAAVV